GYRTGAAGRYSTEFYLSDNRLTQAIGITSGLPVIREEQCELLADEMARGSRPLARAQESAATRTLLACGRGSSSNGVCGGADHLENAFRLGEHRHMAAVELVGGRAHALCKEALQIRMNGAVIFADDVPAWLRFPGGSSDFSFEQVGFWSPLRRQNKLFLVLGQIPGERVDAFRKQPDTSVLDVDVRKDIRLWEVRLLCLR